MTGEEFNEVLERRINLCREVLTKKAGEYSTDKSRFHNFEQAGALLGEDPAKALLGMMTKHIVSVIDMVKSVEKGQLPTTVYMDEKIGDTINYLILLEGVITEKIWSSIEQSRIKE